MRTKVFQGSFREIGRQQGAEYRRNGTAFGGSKNIDKALYRRQKQIYEKYYPQFLEECRGVAEGGGYDSDQVTYSFTTGQLRHYRKQFGLNAPRGCTIIGVAQGKNLYVGRNYDFIPAAEDLFGVYKVKNPQRNSFASVSDMYIDTGRHTAPKNFLYEGEDVLNDKGLYAGITFAYAESWSYGIAWSHMLRLIAETCATVEDALKVFKKVPLCTPKNFFIADARGNVAVVEHAAKKYRVLHPQDGVLIHTNHLLHPDLLELDRVLKHNPAHNTFLRYYEALREINARKGRFTRREIPMILRRSGTYLRQNSSDDATIWTLALDMTGRDYALYWGFGDTHRRARLAV